MYARINILGLLLCSLFSREVEAGDYETVGVLYQRWLRIVLKILPQR